MERVANGMLLLSLRSDDTHRMLNRSLFERNPIPLASHVVGPACSTAKCLRYCAPCTDAPVRKCHRFAPSMVSRGCPYSCNAATLMSIIDPSNRARTSMAGEASMHILGEKGDWKEGEAEGGRMSAEAEGG